MNRLLQRTTLLATSLSVALAVPTGAAAALPKVVAGDGVLCDLTRTLSGLSLIHISEPTRPY